MKEIRRKKKYRRNNKPQKNNNRTKQGQFNTHRLHLTENESIYDMQLRNPGGAKMLNAAIIERLDNIRKCPIIFYNTIPIDGYRYMDIIGYWVIDKMEVVTSECYRIPGELHMRTRFSMPNGREMYEINEVHADQQYC